MTPSTYRIDLWRLREILRSRRYRTLSVTGSIGGGWFAQRKPLSRSPA